MMAFVRIEYNHGNCIDNKILDRMVEDHKKISFKLKRREVTYLHKATVIPPPPFDGGAGWSTPAPRGQ